MAALRRITCQCRAVQFEATGKPIVSAVCYCTDCQAAGELIEKAYDAACVKYPDGGTAYVTLREDHWNCLEGSQHLEAVKLTPKSPTTRYVTTCCHSAMYLKYKHGFWVSTYWSRYPEPRPKLEWRNKIGSRNSDLPFPDNLPRFKSFPIRLFGRLIRAKFSR